MARALFFVCALLCLFVLSARSEVNVPWPPSSPPDCSTTWEEHGDAYTFCHMDFSGSGNDNLRDSQTVSNELEPCNYNYFLIDRSTFSGGLQFGDWLQVQLDFETSNGTGSSIQLYGGWESLPTEFVYDFQFGNDFLANTTFSISPYYVSYYPSIWLAVGNFERDDLTTSTELAAYTLTVERYRPSRECDDLCICDATLGYSEIVLLDAVDDHVVLTGSFTSDDNSVRNDIDLVDVVYERMRNFFFTVSASAYRPGAYLDINITVTNGSAALEGAYLSKGPYAVDPYPVSTQTNVDAFWTNASGLETEPCVNENTVPGRQNHVTISPCEFYYGDYYLSILFVEADCDTGATYEITVNVIAPIVKDLALNTPVTNNLESNIFLGVQAGYSQFDHYKLVVSGTTGRTHAFVRLSSVYGSNLELFARTSDQTNNAIAFESFDQVLNPFGYNGDSVECESTCYSDEWSCSTNGDCGCYFIIPSCEFADDTYYLSVVPLDGEDTYYVDGISYHIEVNTAEDSLSVALVPGEPVVATLPVWTPAQVYTFATPNSVDTWAVVELFVRAPSTGDNQLGQPALTLSLQQGAPSYDICERSDLPYKTCTTNNFFEGESDDGTGLSPTACHIFVDTCRLNSGPIYLVVFNDDDFSDINAFGVNQQQWDYVLWADLETAWALDSDVTYTDRIHPDFYNHYYIDVDDSIEAGSWLSVDFENIKWLDDVTDEFSFAVYLNYDSLAGECPCYDYVDICTLDEHPGSVNCGDESCATDVNGWSENYGFDLSDNEYVVQPELTDFETSACRVQATVCSFRPGRWYVSAFAYTSVFQTPSDAGKYLLGYTMTARIHAAPVVNELEFNEQITEQLQPNEVRHFQLTNVDASGDDLVITVGWYEEAISRFSKDSRDTLSLQKSYDQAWGIEARLNFGDLAFEECYEHPWSCTASFLSGGSCQIIVPVCKWAQVDPDEIFVSVRYFRGVPESDGDIWTLDLGFDLSPVDILVPEFWVGEAQFNLLVSSERAEVTALAVGTPVYGSVSKDRYAHYSLQLLQTQGLRTDIDVFFNVQTGYDLAEYAPILALNEGSLAGNGRGCRDCFSTIRSCQNDAACHWTFDSCDSLSVDTAYFLSVYKPANAFYDQTLEFALSVSQQDLIVPVSLTSEGRTTTTIKLQDEVHTRVFFEIDGSSLTARQSPFDALYITLWSNGAYDANFTAFLNHGGLAGACPCYERICQEEFTLSTECPIFYHHDDYDKDFRGALVDFDLEAGAYFVTLEFDGVVGSDAVVITIEADAVYYPVYDITPTNFRESGSPFTLGDFALPYGERIGGTEPDDYNAGYNMDDWLVTTGGDIDWATSNVFRDHVVNPNNFLLRYRISAPSRLADLNWQNLNFYAVTVTSSNTEAGFPMPNRVFIGIDNLYTDYDNCKNPAGLEVSWFGTTELALNPNLASTVFDASRTTCSNFELDDRYYFLGETSTTAGDLVYFRELPPCLFTHAGEATHYFGVEAQHFVGDQVELADGDGTVTARFRGSVYYDIRFFLQTPIPMDNIDQFYLSPNFNQITVDPPYTTNWQPFVFNGRWSKEFKQRFELDLTAAIAGLEAPFVQVVIEHEDSLIVTLNGDYAPNFATRSCWGACSLRSVLEVRSGSLSADQLINANIVSDLESGSTDLTNAASNSRSYVLPNGDLEYVLAGTGSSVFTLDPCALEQSSVWFFDIISEEDSNSTFWVYFTTPVDLLEASVTQITTVDVTDRDWVPAVNSITLEDLDDYEFLFIDIDALDLTSANRPRLEIQIDWADQFDVDIFAGNLSEFATIVISRDAPLFLKGEGSNFPFFDNVAPANEAFPAGLLDQTNFDSFTSYIAPCFAPFYVSTVGGDYNSTNPAARSSQRFFLDGCDLAGVSEIWITARLLTAGYRDFNVLARVVEDQIVTPTELAIGSGYPDTPSFIVQSDVAEAIEPHSFNHHVFLLPADLQTGSPTTLIAELKFPDDDIDRYNGTFYMLFSTDAPAGFTSSFTPENYQSDTDTRYTSTVYGGLLTFGSQATADDASTALYDCYTNLADYQASPLQFDPLDTGILLSGEFDSEYRTRRSIDLFNFRYATTLWVSIYFDASVWEEFDPQTEDDVLGWQGYELRVWTQAEPADAVLIERNETGNDICWLLSTDTGVEPNAFDYNITWGQSSLTPTWFAFELTEDLVSLDCSSLATDECLFSQWLEFKIYNDEIQDWTYGTEPFIGYQPGFPVFGPARYNIGGSGDMYAAADDSDIVGGKWTIHDSHITSDLRTTSSFFANLDVNSSSASVRFFPCASSSVFDGEGYGINSDWVFNDAFMARSTLNSLRPGTYYVPIWTADSLDFTICATLNSFGYDTNWLTINGLGYIPDEITADSNGANSDDVYVIAQETVPFGVDGFDVSYQYFWFHLDDADFDDADYLQVWLDNVLFCADTSLTDCSTIAPSDDIVLQMFRSDCQLWTCEADGEGAGCEGRFQIGSPDLDNLDFFFDDVSRFILGGAGLSPCSLTAGDFFIKVSLPDNATYTLSVYLRSPPTTQPLTAAVAARSTIFLSAFQHYTFTSADSDSLLLTGLEVSLEEVACGVLELFAKRGSHAGPFYPTKLDRNTFIGSQMYNPATISSGFGFPPPISPPFQGSLLEKCSSAYCLTSNTNSCSVVFGTTELSKDFDASGLLGSTTWYFSVRAVDSTYHTDNDEASNSFPSSTPGTSFYGTGFFEPVTYFITATPSFTEVTSVFTWGCLFTPETEEVACSDQPFAEDSIPVYSFGFHTVTLFTDAFVSVSAESSLIFLNATVEDVTKPDGPAITFAEPVEQLTTSDTWNHVISRWSPVSVDGIDTDSSNVLTAGPKNIFVTADLGSVFADFYHHPVLPAAPGVIYSATGRDYNFARFANRFIDIHYAFYEFSPALTSTPSFSLSVLSDNTDANCIRTTFWIQNDENCGQYDPSYPSNSAFWDCPENLPRFVSLRFDTCSLPCSENDCSPFQFELGYQTSLDITDLELGVESCGSSWTSVQFTEQLTFSEVEWLIFSLPVDVQPSTETTASWLTLDFYPSLMDYCALYVFESDSLLCSSISDSSRRGFFSQQASFFCPDDAFAVVSTDSFIQDYVLSSITPSNFEIPVVESGTLSTTLPGSQLDIPVSFGDFVRFDFRYQFAVYSFVVPESLDNTVSTLSVSFEPTLLCEAVAYHWWLNLDSPLPSDCDDLPHELAQCAFVAGTYFVSVQIDSYTDASQDGSDNPYPDWSATITVSLDVLDVLLVPEDGSFSDSYTVEPGQSIYFQTALSQEWLNSHPALQNEIIYRLISPLGQPTLLGSNTEPISGCFDCAAPVFSALYTNDFNVPFEFTVQFELLSDLLLNFDPSVIYQAYADNYAVAATTFPLWFFTHYQPLLAPHFDQRGAIINTLVLGLSVPGTLYNAFTYRQLQVYQVSTVTANAIGQIRLSDVIGGIVSAQVFPASLSLACGEFKECHSAPLQYSENHRVLQTNPVDNLAGSCSIVYSPCEWSASASYFVVLHDHVVNEPPAVEGEVFQSPTDNFADWSTSFDPENTTLSNPLNLCFPWGCSNYVPTQSNPFESTQFSLTVTEEFYATDNFPTTPVVFSSRPNPSSRSAPNPAGNWQHFFYSYEASDVSSLVISVEVTSSEALASSGVWVTVSDSDCGCSNFVRNIWCSAEYPSWLCEIEIPTHADHPLTSTTFYIDVYGLKGTFSLDVSEGFDNCVFSDGQDFCPTRVLNYAYWPSLSDSELDGKASCLYDTILPFFEEHECSDCIYEIPDECKLALIDYACAASFQPCDVNGFIDATICVDKCTAVESACPYSFIEAGLPTLDCGSARYSTTNCF